MKNLRNGSNSELLYEGKKAHQAIGDLVKLNTVNVHFTEEFIDLFKERFSFLFRNSMQNYMQKQEFLEHTSKVVNYLETMLLPNFKEDFKIRDLPPKLQLLFFRSINEAYLEFKKRHDFPM
ncbi:MAG: hypothetical protein PHU63_03590 [Candidatus ainarchaeum sp.]|nr:hypothetical protein [Candidatus ainarchaeum sp.]